MHVFVTLDNWHWVFVCNVGSSGSTVSEGPPKTVEIGRSTPACPGDIHVCGPACARACVCVCMCLLLWTTGFGYLSTTWAHQAVVSEGPPKTVVIGRSTPARPGELCAEKQSPKSLSLGSWVSPIPPKVCQNPF